MTEERVEFIEYDFTLMVNALKEGVSAFDQLAMYAEITAEEARRLGRLIEATEYCYDIVFNELSSHRMPVWLIRLICRALPPTAIWRFAEMIEL